MQPELVPKSSKSSWWAKEQKWDFCSRTLEGREALWLTNCQCQLSIANASSLNRTLQLIRRAHQLASGGLESARVGLGGSQTETQGHQSECCYWPIQLAYHAYMGTGIRLASGGAEGEADWSSGEADWTLGDAGDPKLVSRTLPKLLPTQGTQMGRNL